MIINGSQIKRRRWPVQPVSARMRNKFPPPNVGGWGAVGRVWWEKHPKNFSERVDPEQQHGAISVKSSQIWTCVDLHHIARLNGGVRWKITVLEEILSNPAAFCFFFVHSLENISLICSNPWFPVRRSVIPFADSPHVTRHLFHCFVLRFNYLLRWVRNSVRADLIVNVSWS